MVYRLRVGPTAVREAARLLWGQPGTEHVYFEARNQQHALDLLAGAKLSSEGLQEWPAMPGIHP